MVQSLSFLVCALWAVAADEGAADEGANMLQFRMEQVDGDSLSTTTSINNTVPTKKFPPWVHLGTNGSIQCRPGFRPLDEPGCKGYSETVKADFQRSSNETNPTGCSRSGQTVLFNTHLIGSSNMAYKVVCEAELPALDKPFVMQNLKVVHSANSYHGQVGHDASGNLLFKAYGDMSYVDYKTGIWYFNGEAIDFHSSHAQVEIASRSTDGSETDMIVVTDQVRVEAEIAESSSVTTALIGDNLFKFEKEGDVSESFMTFDVGTSLLQRKTSFIPILIGWAIWGAVAETNRCNPNPPPEDCPATIIHRRRAQPKHRRRDVTDNHRRRGTLLQSTQNLANADELSNKHLISEMVDQLCKYFICAGAGQELSHMITNSSARLLQ